jgi:hypothetical protein
MLNVNNVDRKCQKVPRSAKKCALVPESVEKHFEYYDATRIKIALQFVFLM